MIPPLKATKEEFGYVEGKRSAPICKKCKYFVRAGECLLVKGKISGENGSCNLWVDGPMRFWPINSPLLTKTESGYVETPKGARCGECTFYSYPRQCELVKGDIDPKNGCCNAWKKKEKS